MRAVIRRIFIKGEERLTLRSYYWTVLSGTAYAMSSFLLLLVTTNLLGAYAGGLFSIALTIGQQVQTIGYYNVRTFQVSDVKQQFSFGDYLISRCFTTFLMFAAGVIWIVAGGYAGEKLWMILLMLLFKMGECIADVLEGQYQQKGRMDVVGKCVFYETVISVGAFLLVLVLCRQLLWAMLAMLVSYLLSLLVIDGMVVGWFGKITLRMDWDRQKGILLSCLPLFVNSFLMMYINNSSKYAMDAIWSEEALGVFNVLFMPAFVINLLAGFLLRPILNSLSIRYHEGDRKGFGKALRLQGLYIAGITVICIGGAYVLGIPVLSVLYGLDLSAYRAVLCILLLGGGFTAVYQMFQNALIIMRRQYACLVGCTITALAAALLIRPLVLSYGIYGAGAGYLALMVLLAGIYFIMVLVYRRKDEKEE